MTLIDRLYNLSDVRDAAQSRLPKGVFEFIDRGTEDEDGLANNRAAFRRVKLRTRAAVDVSGRSTACTLFGQESAMPLVIAPTGAAGLVWYHGELELARAAAEFGVPFTLATRSMTSIEDIARLAGGTLWFQLYIWTQRELSYQLVDRAQAAGYKALVVTLDVPVMPNREYNRRNGFSLPWAPNARSIADMLQHPRWLIGTMGRYLATTGMPRYENQSGEYREKITQGKALRGDNVTWDDIALLRRRWKGTLIVKGILRAEDAVAAVLAGADAVVVSNHGGRCLDSAVATLDVLPEIVSAVSRDARVLLDSGVRRGSDIVKALALGASAVMSGRPCLYGLGVAGRPGAEKVLQLLQSEMSTTMGMLGTPRVANIDDELIYRRPVFHNNPHSEFLEEKLT